MKNKSICITQHAYSRMRKRNGWNKRTANRMMQRVYDNGLRPEQLKGYLKAWMMTKVNEDMNGNDFVLYGETVYVFREKALITVLHIPSKRYIRKCLF